MRLALIGVGSPFSDDTLGWQLLDALSDRGMDMPGWEVTYQKADRPGAGLLSYLEGLDAAVILDAMQANREAGTLLLLDVRDLEQAESKLSGHALGVAETLSLGEKLDMLPPRLYIVGIAMGRGLGSGLVGEAAVLIEDLF